MLGISGNKKYGENLYMSIGSSAQEQGQRSVDSWYLDVLQDMDCTTLFVCEGILRSSTTNLKTLATAKRLGTSPRYRQFTF